MLLWCNIMLQVIIDFIINNWTWILPILLSIVESFLIIILKKHPVTAFFDSFYCEIVDLINDAEDAFGDGNGSYKLDYVVTHFLMNHPSFHKSTVIDAVEDIMSTPKKKKGGKK